MGFAHWKVRTKLLAGFSIVLALMMVIGFISLAKLTELKRELTLMVEDRYVKVAQVNDMIARTIDVGRLMRDAVLSNTAADVESSIQKIEEHRQKNTQILDGLKATITAEKGKLLLNTALEKRVILSATYDKLYASARAMDKETSIGYLKGEFIASNAAFIDALQAMKGFQEQLMAESELQSEASLASAQQMIIGVLALSVLLGLWLSIWLANRFGRALGSAEMIAERIAAGDLSAPRLDVEPDRDEVGALVRALLKMRTELAGTIETVVKEATLVASSAEQLSTAAQQVSTSTMAQSDSTASAAGAVEELTVSIDHVSNSSDQAKDEATEAGKIAAIGVADVDDATHQVLEVASSVERSTAQIQTLSEKVQAIGSIATVIKEIADQTNLLALNAAIEAARAGEQGRGFAVVADEVRQLAERTTASVQEIAGMISAIQSGTREAVSSMEHSRDMVGSVAETSKKASQAISSIQSATSVVLEAIGDIANALHEQRLTSVSLAQSVETVAQMSEENAAAVSSVAHTADNLVSVSSTLRQCVSHFKV